MKIVAVSDLFAETVSSFDGYTLPARVRQVDPSWPWRSDAARKVYRAAGEIARKDKSLTDVSAVFKQALADAGVGVRDLPREDTSVMGIAIQWMLSGKVADPEPITPINTGKPPQWR